MAVVKRKEKGDEGLTHPALAVEDEVNLTDRGIPLAGLYLDEFLVVDVGGVEMEASCSAGACRLAGAGRAVTGFGPSRRLKGPWRWVTLSLLCARASIGVADELAVAHAEALLEQRIDLGHRQPLFEGFDDLRRDRRIGHPAFAPPRSFLPRSLCHRLLPGPLYREKTAPFQSLANKGKLRRTPSFFDKTTVENRGFDGDCQRMTEFDGERQRLSDNAKDFDGKMCDVGLHHRLRLTYSPSARRER